MTTRTRTAAVLAIAALAAAALPTAAASPAAAASLAAAAQNPTSCSATTSIVNGGFEDPVIPPNEYWTFDDADVPGWQTTASDHMFEYWSTGWDGVPSAEGNAFVELNANVVSTLFQDVATIPGTTILWSLQHRGRDGDDILRVLIGDPSALALTPFGDFTDGNTAWGTHGGTYLVPAGQTTTRFAFESVSAAGGDPTYGNFLDDVSFGTDPCIITGLSVKNLANRGPAYGGDRLRYTVTVANRGIVAVQAALSDLLPGDVTYVPGSLRIVSGIGAGSLTDAAGDDAGDVDLATGEVRVRLGTGANAATGGSLPAGRTVTIRFDVVTSISPTPRTTTNTATTQFSHPISGAPLTSTSQTTALAIAAVLAASGGSPAPGGLPLAALLIAGGVVLVLRSRGRALRS